MCHPYMCRGVRIVSSQYTNTMKNKALVFALTMLAVVTGSFTSCISPKEIVYLRDAELGRTESIGANFQTTIQKDDQLEITVSSKQPELTQPFTVSDFGGNSSGSSNKKIYQVDVNGNIVLPVIGTMSAAGKTCAQLGRDISSALRGNEYISDASVNVRIANFKYSVLGEVASPGIKSVSGERITILEAISQAGDLKDDASRVITVLREQNGKRNMATVDLRSKSLFTSPYYYLQQNDVIYVTRLSHRFNMLRGDTMQWWTFGVGATGIIIGIVALCAL